MSRGNKRLLNSKTVKFKLGEKAIVSRSNKRPMNSERVEFKPGKIEIAPRGKKGPVNSAFKPLLELKFMQV